jgi:hypothetical protein
LNGLEKSQRKLSMKSLGQDQRKTHHVSQRS